MGYRPSPPPPPRAMAARTKAALGLLLIGLPLALALASTGQGLAAAPPQRKSARPMFDPIPAGGLDDAALMAGIRHRVRDLLELEAKALAVENEQDEIRTKLRTARQMHEVATLAPCDTRPMRR